MQESIELPWEEAMQAWDMNANGLYELTPEVPGKKYRHPQKWLLKHSPK